MTVVRLFDESPTKGSYRIPQFEVRIEGVGLPRNVLRDVTQLTYRDSVNELDSFELTVNNWNPDTRKFKYVGSETAAQLEGTGPESALYKLFEPCGKEVEVKLGYMGELQTMLTGNFTTMEPTFPSSGAPTLTVRGLNVLHQLRRKQYTWSWENKKDSEIAEDLGTLRDQETGNKRFPLPVVTDAPAKGREVAIPYVAEHNQYDIDFLAARARERGYVIIVQERTAQHPRRLYFGPAYGGRGVALRPVTYELGWGKTLVEFKPTFTSANQVKSVTVHGWDRTRHEDISVTVDLNDRELNRNRDLQRILRSCDAREEVVVNAGVFNRQDARRRAIAILTNRQRSMVRATATTVGLPDLRAGQLVRITDVGARFSGTYFITDTTHTIDPNSGYTTRFSLYREDGGDI